MVGRLVALAGFFFIANIGHATLSTQVIWTIQPDSYAEIRVGDLYLLFDSKYHSPAIQGALKATYTDDGFYAEGGNRYQIRLNSLVLKINALAQKSPNRMMLRLAPEITFEGANIVPKHEKDGTFSFKEFILHGDLKTKFLSQSLSSIDLSAEGGDGQVQADIHALIDLRKVEGLGEGLLKLIGTTTANVEMHLKLVTKEPHLAHSVRPTPPTVVSTVKKEVLPTGLPKPRTKGQPTQAAPVRSDPSLPPPKKKMPAPNQYKLQQSRAAKAATPTRPPFVQKIIDHMKAQQR